MGESQIPVGCPRVQGEMLKLRIDRCNDNNDRYNNYENNDKKS